MGDTHVRFMVKGLTSIIFYYVPWIDMYSHKICSEIQVFRDGERSC